MKPDGTVTVAGCIGNKVLSYGMLEAAKDAIRNFRPDAIEVPKPEARGVLLNGAKH